MMPEAEVSLNLALYLVRNTLVTSNVMVAIDGAQVETSGNIIFPIEDFMEKNNCQLIKKQRDWRGIYSVDNSKYNIEIHSTPGKGDVVAKLINGFYLRVESKKGSLSNSKSSKEYPLMREAIGQLMTIEDYKDNDKLAIAIPNSPKFKSLSDKWKKAPLIQKIELCFLLVEKNGNVVGLEEILI
nr:hypothetical protein [uncultured Methanolobus sp.]